MTVIGEDEDMARVAINGPGRIGGAALKVLLTNQRVRDARQVLSGK